MAILFLQICILTFEGPVVKALIVKAVEETDRFFIKRSEYHLKKCKN